VLFSIVFPFQNFSPLFIKYFTSYYFPTFWRILSSKITNKCHFDTTSRPHSFHIHTTLRLLRFADVVLLKSHLFEMLNLNRQFFFYLDNKFLTIN